MDDLFDDEQYGLNWNPLDYVEWYAAEISALSFNDGCVDVKVKGAPRSGQAVEVQLSPPTRYLNVNNELSTVVNRKNVRGVGMEREPESRTLSLKGSVLAKRAATHWATVPNPTLYFMTVLKETLEAEGIRIQGTPRDFSDGTALPAKALWKKLDTYRSPPLTSLMEVCLKNSQNLYAEHFLKTLGARCYGKGSLVTGALAIKDILFNQGCDIDDQFIADGSGLSRENRVNADAFVRVLQTIERSPYRQMFWDMLPCSGVDGTLENRMRGVPAYKRVHAKTGTLNGVRALSGYIQSQSGKTYIFSMLANGTRAASRYTRIMDNACDLLASQ